MWQIVQVDDNARWFHSIRDDQRMINKWFAGHRDHRFWLRLGQVLHPRAKPGRKNHQGRGFVRHWSLRLCRILGLGVGKAARMIGAMSAATGCDNPVSTWVHTRGIKSM